MSASNLGPWARRLALGLTLAFPLILAACAFEQRPPTPASAGYDLARDEARGGHTLERHVGRSDAELAARLAREPNLRTASSFLDRATAERVVAATLAEAAPRIARWRERGPRRPNLALDHRGDPAASLGRTMRRSERESRPAFGARVVLRAAGSDFYVLTAYPTEEP